MKRALGLILALWGLSLVLLLNACTMTLPIGPVAATPAPASTTLAPAEATPTEAQPSSPDTQSAPSPEAAQPQAEAPTPPPAPTIPPGPAPEIIRDAALDFLRGAYLLKVPDNAAFAPAELRLEGLEVSAGYASDVWQVLIGPHEMIDGLGVTTVVVQNGRNDMRWWGAIDDTLLATTSVGVLLPQPKSRRVDGWVGKIVKLPAGSAYDDYFESKQGERHGITSNRANAQTMLDSLTDYAGRVKIWGELIYAAPDYNGRQILARRIELLDGDLISPADAETSATPEPTPTPYIGPIGALISPIPDILLSQKVMVAGDAENAFENNVIVRVETEAGDVLGEAQATTNASAPGQRGGFSVEVSFNNPAVPMPGRVTLYAEDPAEGGLMLLAWVNVRLAGPDGAPTATIILPTAGASIQGPVTVQGLATGVPRARVIVRVEDAGGELLGKAEVRLESADGSWQVQVKFRKPASAQPGQIAVYSVKPDGTRQDLLARVDVMLAAP